LGAALDGIENQMEPASPIVGNAYAVDGLPQIPDSWEAAIDAMESSTIVSRFIHPELIKNLVSTKRQELHYIGELTETERVELYLDTV
jgi:glutamine synthetase